MDTKAEAVGLVTYALAQATEYARQDQFEDAINALASACKELLALVQSR